MTLMSNEMKTLSGPFFRPDKMSFVTACQPRSMIALVGWWWHLTFERVSREIARRLDIAFLEQVLDDAQALRPFLEAHPAYQTLAARTFALYKDIVARAAENEAAARG